MIVKRIEADLGVTYDPNPEVGQRWYPLIIGVRYDAAYKYAQNYVSIQGRLKYIQPVYRALVTAGRRDLAYQWFILNQNFYHPIAIDSIRSIVLNTTPSQLTMDRIQWAFKSSTIRL